MQKNIVLKKDVDLDRNNTFEVLKQICHGKAKRNYSFEYFGRR